MRTTSPTINNYDINILLVNNTLSRHAQHFQISEQIFIYYVAASMAKNKTDALANEEILYALSKRGPDALDVLVEALEVEEDVYKRVIEKIRKGSNIEV